MKYDPNKPNVRSFTRYVAARGPLDLSAAEVRAFTTYVRTLRSEDLTLDEQRSLLELRQECVRLLAEAEDV